MPKPIDDSKIVDMNQYKPLADHTTEPKWSRYESLRGSVQDAGIDWMSVPEIDTMVSMLASEDAEGLSEFMALGEGENVALELEITDTRLAQAVLHSIRMHESFVPGMKIKTIKLNPEQE